MNGLVKLDVDQVVISVTATHCYRRSLERVERWTLDSFTHNCAALAQQESKVGSPEVAASPGPLDHCSISPYPHPRYLLRLQVWAGGLAVLMPCGTQTLHLPL